MKKFTKLFLSLALLLVGVGEANAATEKVYADLSQYGDKWDGTSLSFSWTATSGNQLGPNLDAIGLPKGNLSTWEKLVVVVDELTNCDFFRVLVYSGNDTNHSSTFKVTKTGNNEFTLSGVDGLDLTNVTRICLSGSNWEDAQNSTWSETPASFKVKEVYLERTETKVPIKLTGGHGENNASLTDVATVTPQTGSSLDNLYGATFTPTGNFVNIFQYNNMDVSDYEKIIIKFDGEVGSGWKINLPNGDFKDINTLYDNTTHVLTIDLATNHYTTYGDFTIFNWAGTYSPITITECYFYGARPAISIPEPNRTATDAKVISFDNFGGTTWDATTKTFTGTCGFNWGEDGIDLSQYRYLVITAGHNRDQADAGKVTIKDKNGVVVAGDDYGVSYLNMWMSTWNHLFCCNIDLEKLRVEKSFDIYHITELSIDGGSGFLMGTVYASNTEPNVRNRWGQNDEGSFRITDVEPNTFGTICLPYQAAVACATIYEIDGKTSDGISLKEVDGLLEAGKPYIYKKNPNKVPSWIVDEGKETEHTEYSNNTIYFYQATAATVTNAGNSNGLVGTFSILPDLELTPSGTKLVTKRILANQAYVDLNAVTGTGSETTLATSDETESWTSLNDDNSYVFKQHGIGGPWVATLTDGVCAVESFDKVSAEWDTQFWIRANKKLPANTKFFVSFQYKADNTATVSTQQHKKPSEYLGGTIGNLNFTNDWNTFAGEFTSYENEKKEMMSSIAFNLNQTSAANKYYFKNVKFEVLSDVAGTLDDADPVDAIPTPTITVGDALYSTYSANYSVKFDNVEAYTAKYDATDKCVKLAQVTEIPANTAVVIKAAAADKYTESLTRVITAVENNDLKVSQWGENQATGDGTIYVLAKKGDVVGFYKLADEEKVPVGKGYLTIATAAGREFIGFADDATTIKAVESLKESGLIYNLAGQQVKNAQKGVFIINGKKVIK